MRRMTFTQVPGPRPRAARPAPAQLPWGTVEPPDPGPSLRASWPRPWPWPALRRAALTRQLLAPRAIPLGPPQCPQASSQGRPSPTICSAKPYSMRCRPPGSPAFRIRWNLNLWKRTESIGNASSSRLSSRCLICKTHQLN
ncbi:uncharacterized protein LOC100525054 isoform X1 [Sus scrofa]|uniref:uncharacterized protein LOC100525054 isoform X1 n=1 Tax=Sus scrofa TaxID=9823 RepID=UPI000A2B94EB|nr:uncharacterized protein LOC100525054 isoform X1 [Sus scrofa]